ncbi:NmrA family NAD(P)-binding protein [Actinoplanes sp. NPDC026670]|uniref:NmrA family NAD(P)-binding protein n=1 Tax=Actinoplanes sp. NPDC026670 TaxID=3154700 RepID=UPI0033CE54E2
MTNSMNTVLVLGGTGRTGSLVAAELRNRGLPARTAARSGADVSFDWDDPASQATALDGVDRVYLVAPVPRTRYAEQVSDFLDLAEKAGVRHITHLSTYRAEDAPETTDFAAVEAELRSRTAFTHTILQPGWVMQNFADHHVPIVDDVITVPAGTGAEAFVDAADIAAVAAATLADPTGHAGRRYVLTGPEALTFTQVAETIGDVTGRPVRFQDIDRDTWVRAVVATGFVPADYGVVLDWQTSAVAGGNGSRPTGDIERVLGRPPRSLADFARRAWPVNSDDFAALNPFFDIVARGLAGLVDGDHYFDTLAEDAVFEYVITVPGYPRRVVGRTAVADLYRDYGDSMVLYAADQLAVHHDREKSVVVLEYTVHGRATATGADYTNNFVSVITIRDRKISRWRDYLDPIAVFDIHGWPASASGSPQR